MVVAIGAIVLAVAAGVVLGWRTGVEVAAAYGFCLVGANSPQTFIRSRQWLERVANSTAAKAKEQFLKKDR